MLTVIDRDFNIIMSNWHESGMVPEEARQGRPKCYRVFHHRERPCKDCHVHKVFASGQPQKTEKINLLDGRTREFSAFPVLSESGQVILAAEHVRDVTGRYQAAKALKESEERFRAIFAAAQDAIFIKDRSLHYTQVNPAMERLFDRPAADLVGKTDKDLFGTQAGVLIRAQDLRVLSGEVVTEVNTRLVREESKTFHVVKAPLHDDAGQVMGLCGIARDISDLKRAEDELVRNHAELQETTQRLEQSRNILQLVLESIPVRVFWKDADLRYLGCNTLFARDAGLDHPEQLLGLDDFAMGWREQAELYRMDDRQVMESLRPKINLVEPQTTPAGDKIWLKTSKVPLQRPDGEVFGVLGLYEDITAHKQAEEALEEREVTLRTLIEANPESLFLLDTRGVILAANRVAAQRLDKPLEEIIGADAFALVPPELGRKRFEIFQQVVATGSPERFEDVRGEFHLDISMTPIFNQGKVVQVAVLAVDVSLRKLAEAALRESEQRFRLMAETIQDVFWIATPTLDRVIYASPAYEQVWGYQLPRALSESPKP